MFTRAANAMLPAGLLLLSACSTVPYTGRHQLKMLPAGQELSLGEESYKEELSKVKVSADPGKTAMVTKVSMAIANVAKNDPEILKIWAVSGMALYPKEQRTPEGAAAYLKKEIAHWGEVVRANKIEPPTN